MTTSEGMVAVVRGLGEQGISVTLLDGNQQFTLVPNSVAKAGETSYLPNQSLKTTGTNPPKRPKYQPRLNQGNQCQHCCCHQTTKQVQNSSCTTEETVAPRNDSGVQASDGRYTSTYRMSHCHVAPTSPEHQVTEFPPQRTSPRPGQGNFVVGGTGSNDAKHTPTRTTEFRGAMCWPDRGAVFSPRPSRQTDSFANSLRQYPGISPDRSTEIVERLINYTQAKNASKNASNYTPSISSRVTSIDNRMKQDKSYNVSQVNKSPYDSKVRQRNNIEVKPTREIKNRFINDKDVFQRNYDVRLLRNYSLYQKLIDPPSPKSIDSKKSEIQAAAIKTYKNVSVSEQRSVATLPTPLASPSTVSNISIFRTYSMKSVQSPGLLDIASNADMLRRSKSYEILLSDSAEELRLEILDWFRNISLKPSCDRSERDQRYNLLKRLKTKLDNMSISFQHKTACNVCRSKGPVNIVQNVHVTNINAGFMGMQRVNRNINYPTSANLLIFEISNPNGMVLNQFEETIVSWFETINLNTSEENMILNELLNRLQKIALQRPDNAEEYKCLLKCELMEILEKTPLKPDGGNLTVYKHRIADRLIQNLINIPVPDLHNRIKAPTESELRHFVREEIQDLEVNDLVITPKYVNCFESELKDILIRATQDDRLEVGDVEYEIGFMLQQYFDLNEVEAVVIAENVVKHYKEYLFLRSHEEIEIKSVKSALIPSSATFLVYQSKSHDTMKSKPAETSIQEVSSSVLKKMGDDYVKALVELINDWLADLSIDTLTQDKKLCKAAVNDLAADIVDRKRYSELNSSKVTDEEELEHLKYQIFKWINRFVGEDNKDTISHAPELLKRIQSVPVPMLIKPQSSSEAQSNALTMVEDGERSTDGVIKVVNEWLNDVPVDWINDKDLNKRIKDFADTIDKKLNANPKNPAEVVDKLVADLCKKVMKENNAIVIDDLKLRIKKCRLKEEDYVKPDPRLFKNVIRNLEDLIDDWLETFPEEILSHNSLINNRYKLVHELAVKIADERSKGLENKYHDEICNWISKLPNQPKDKKVFKQHNAYILLKMILETDLNKSISSEDKQNTQEFVDSQIEGALLEWIKSTPLYRDRDDVDKKGQEAVMKHLALAINALKDLSMGEDITTELRKQITKHVKLIPLGKGKHLCCMNDNFIQGLSTEVEAYLQQQLCYQDLSIKDNTESLRDSVISWMNDLPLPSGNAVELEDKQRDFIETLKKVRRSCCTDSDLRSEILRFLKTLPMDVDEERLNREMENLLLKLSVVPLEDGRRNAQRQQSLMTSKSKVNTIDSSSDSNDNITLSSTSDRDSQTSDLHVLDKSNKTVEGNTPQASSTMRKRDSVSKKKDVSFNVSSITFAKPTMKYLKEWVKDLPISNSDDRHDFCMEMENRIEKIRANPNAMGDQFLLEDMLENEIDSMLDRLNQTSDLALNRHGLKVKLITLVNEENQRLAENLQPNYRTQLKDCLTHTLPGDLDTTSDRQALDELAKDDFVDRFIEINFKGNDNFEKLVYKDRIMDEIKKVVDCFSKNHNGQPVNVKKLQENIYNAMYNVPVPTKQELEEQIKEIAMKQEISEWFNDLPVAANNSPEGILEMNRQKSFLAKKLVDLEKATEEPESMRNHEISNWLDQVPLKKTDQNLKILVEELANRIRNNEILSPDKKTERRQSIDVKDVGYQSFKDDIPLSSSLQDQPNLQKGLQTSNQWNRNNSSYNRNVRQSTDASTSSSQSLIKSCCQSTNDEPKQLSQSTQIRVCYREPKPRKKIKSSDALYNAIRKWCNGLPVKGKNEDAIRMALTNKLVLKLGEVMRNLEILKDRFIFDHYVDNALDEILDEVEDLRPCLKSCLKTNVMVELGEVRQIAINEQEANNFRKEIYDTISKTSPPPCNPAAVEEYKEKLADLLVEINLNPSLDKSLLLDEIGKCLTATKRCANKAQIKGQLYNALLSIKPPKRETLQDELEQIKIKNEIALWMNDLPLQNEAENIRKIKTILAKRLHEIENDGTTDVYNDNMVAEVGKWLRNVLKAGTEQRLSEYSKDLVKRLKETADERSEEQDFDDEVSRSAGNQPGTSGGKSYRCKCSKSRCKKNNTPDFWEVGYPQCFVTLYSCLFR